MSWFKRRQEAGYSEAFVHYCSPAGARQVAEIVVPHGEVETGLLVELLGDKLSAVFSSVGAGAARPILGRLEDSEWAPGVTFSYSLSAAYFGRGLSGLQIEAQRGRDSVGWVCLAVGMARYEDLVRGTIRQMLVQAGGSVTPRQTVFWRPLWIADPQVGLGAFRVRLRAFETAEGIAAIGDYLSVPYHNDARSFPHRVLLEPTSIGSA